MSNHFLSARASEADRIKGLFVGGDDYLVKPFSMKELHARVIAHLRREHRQHGLTRKHLYFGHLIIDIDGREIYYQNQEISFTTKEFDIIEFLALHPGQVFSREQIYEKLWGYEAEGDSSTITEHVKRLGLSWQNMNRIQPIFRLYGEWDINGESRTAYPQADYLIILSHLTIQCCCNDHYMGNHSYDLSFTNESDEPCQLL